MMDMEWKPDIIIVGTGAAGLFTALKFPETAKILMLTKDEVLRSDSYLAQGGISTLKTPDDFESYYEDTMKAGRYENNKDSVKLMIERSPKIMEELMNYGVDFDREDGALSYTREGGHSKFRILHHKDVTGKEITTKLYECVRKRKNIKILEHTKMLDLIIHENRCIGIVIRESEGNVEALYAKSIILATGGIGGLFVHSTNFRHITGDALAIALKHGVEVENIHYIQIHPTALYSTKPGRRFLISESVRGEGAYLLNKDGERFVDELLPRDVVSCAIKEQMEKEESDHVYLSLTHLDGEEVKQRFPNIYHHCLEEGYDLTREPIPITPVQHYHMGGIKVDLDSKTSVEGLLAVGEASCNGVHGANRLASNSLLESLVFAECAANYVTSHLLEKEDLHTEVADEDKNLQSVYRQYQEKETVKADLSECQNKDKYPQPDLSSYQEEDLKKEYKKIILDEIKRRDGEFYAKWCNHEN